MTESCKTETDPIAAIVQAAKDAMQSASSLGYFPPGHHLHRPSDIRQLDKAIAKLQSGVSELKWAIKRSAKENADANGTA